MRRWLIFFGFVLSCGGSSTEISLDAGPAEPQPLLEPRLLDPVELENDPLAGHRPAIVDCPAAAWGPEGGGFEVQTGACNYAAFAHPLREALAAGDQLSIVIWHDILDAAEPATGHAALWLGNTVLWETEVAIPAPSVAYEATVILERDFPAGEQLGLHVHNHGFNSWRFISVDHRAGSPSSR